MVPSSKFIFCIIPSCAPPIVNVYLPIRSEGFDKLKWVVLIVELSLFPVNQEAQSEVICVSSTPFPATILNVF